MLTFTLLHDMPNAVTLGFGLFACVRLIQAFPWPASWLSRKPLGCPTCLTWWCGLFGLAWNAWSESLTITASMLAFWAGAIGFGLVLDALSSWLKPLPPPP